MHLHFFGDSFTEGFGEISGRGWVDRVLDATPEHPGAISGFNHGLRGSTTAQIRTTFDSVLGSSDRSIPGIAVVLCGGANDSLDLSPGGPLRTGTSLANMTAMVERCRSEAWPVLVVGSPPIIGADEEVRGLLRSFSDDLAAACRAQGVPFIGTEDRLAVDERWRRDVHDGAHPGSLGYQVLADLILERGWLEWVRSAQTES